MLDDFLDRVERTARATKQKVTRRRPRDINPFVFTERAAAPVALVTLNKGNRDNVLQVAAYCAVVFDADQLGLAFESFMPTNKGMNGENINPRTGRMWGPGEMQAAVEQHGAVEAGLITEAVMVVAGNRAGDIREACLPFHYVAGHLVWDEDDFWRMDSRKDDIQGLIPEAVAEIMTNGISGRALLHDAYPGQHFTQSESDAEAGHYLSTQGHVVMMFSEASNSERLARLREFGYSAVPVDSE